MTKEASNLVLRTAVRLMMGEYLYEHHGTTLIEKFRRLEMDGKEELYFPFLVITSLFRFFIPHVFDVFLALWRPEKSQTNEERSGSDLW
jgi:hypothetical protein